MRIALIGWLALFAAAAAGDTPDFIRVMREEGRAVVNIRGVQQITVEYPDDDITADPARAEEALKLDVHNLGSGFILSEDGYIVTNAHVAGGAGRGEIIVRLADRREFPARVVGVDRVTDIAMLKVDAAGLPKVRLGKPEALQAGEWVAAIGSPFGFDHSITAGIVSAIGRALPGQSYAPFIQTDVAVNPGNSGGPLFNLRGEVVGVNSMIYSGSGGYMGLSFAVPIDFAMEVAEQLRARGRVTRGRIGAVLQELTPELARALRVPGRSGALVVSVETGGGAARAGLRPGDVIVRFTDQPVENDTDLVRAIARTRPGVVAAVALLRQGAPLALRVLIDEATPEPSRAAPPVAPERDRQGLQLAPLTREQRDRLDIEGGLLVHHADSHAQQAGLERGDVILSVNGEPAATVSRFRAIVESSAEAGVALLVQRAGGRLFVAYSWLKQAAPRD
jgi:serine protease Do